MEALTDRRLYYKIAESIEKREFFSYLKEHYIYRMEIHANLSGYDNPYRDIKRGDYVVHCEFTKKVGKPGGSLTGYPISTFGRFIKSYESFAEFIKNEVDFIIDEEDFDISNIIEDVQICLFDS